ncbi:MAG: IS1182 family transposase [Acidobacteria bacterium]|nr:MAG: IS1182 family transposase [Acidobacteriota bacterium]
MSLPRERRQASFYSVNFVADGLFEPGSPYRVFREEVLPALRHARPKLEVLYCPENGRPALDPVLMAGVTILQFMEKAPDRKAVEQVKLNLGWKYALDLEWEDTGFHPTSLVVFRDRLLDGEAERIGLDAVLNRLVDKGLVRKRSKQRIDSTHVLANVSKMSRLEATREAMGVCLEDLCKQNPEGLPEAWPSWIERYCETEVDYGQLQEPARMIEKLRQAGEDMAALWAWLETQPELKERDKAKLLKRMFDEQFELQEGKLEVRRVQLAGCMQNPHDPEAQWSSKDPSKKSQWVGYKAQVLETVGEAPGEGGQPTGQFITELTTTEAVASDLAGMKTALEAQQQVGLEMPTHLYADAAYVNGPELAQASEEGRELIGPVKSSPQSKGELYPVESFDIHLAEGFGTCPAGCRSTSCSRVENYDRGQPMYRLRWGSQCRDCPLADKCVGKGSIRDVVVTPNHDHLQKRRREMGSEDFQREARKRNAIEGTISELVRGYGLRKTRYRGLAKTRLANYFIAAACNIRRWAQQIAWLTQVASAQAA